MTLSIVFFNRELFSSYWLVVYFDFHITAFTEIFFCILSSLLVLVLPRGLVSCNLV
jgi:hypothetical protein